MATYVNRQHQLWQLSHAVWAILLVWLACFGSNDRARGDLVTTANSLSLELPPSPTASPARSIRAFSDQYALVEVGSLEGLTLRAVNPLAPNTAFHPRIVNSYQFRETHLVLIQFAANQDGPQPFLANTSPAPSRRYRISWAERAPLPAIGSLPRDSVRLGLTKQNHEVEHEEAPLPRLRIPITESGIYELALTNIANALNQSVSELRDGHFALTHRGQEIPYEIDLASSPSDTSVENLVFYGFGTHTDFTKTNIFWLESRSQPGLRIPTHDHSPEPDITIPSSFPTTIHAEEDLHLWQTMVRGEGQDHWFWGDKLTAPNSREYQIETPFPEEGSAPLTLRIAYHGLTFSAPHNPDHQASLTLNGTLLGTHLWDDRNPTIQEVEFPAELLSGEVNTVTITAPGLPGVVVDQFFINWIEIDYHRRYVARANHLEFGAPFAGKHTFTLEGFESSSLDLLDLSNPLSPQRIEGFLVANSGDRQVVSFTDTADSDSTYLAQSKALRREVTSYSLDSPSHWKDESNGADWIVITHEEFTEAATQLAAHRESKGMRTAVVQIQDVYDEFSFGQFDPQAIRDFLTYAYQNWTSPAPTYVVLLGDAYLDYHDNLKTGTINYIPSQPIHTELVGLSVSDSWFAEVSGDDPIPDIYLGRIPVREAAEADRIIDRIIRYETAPTPGYWTSRVALIADDDSSEFRELSEELATLVPPPLGASRWFTSPNFTPQSADIVSAFESGHGFINYTGHGTVNSWGLSGQGNILLTGSTANTINPADQWPIVTVANCLNGFFAGRKGNPCLAETLLASKSGGAIAVWAPTSLGFPDSHRVLMKEFYQQIFQSRRLVLGQAATAAQIAAFVHDPNWQEIMETYVLFGDPAMRANVNLLPLAPRLTLQPRENGTIELRYDVELGFDYTIYRNNRLDQNDNWTELPDAPHNTGIQVIGTSDSDQEFFKVEAQNPLSPSLDSIPR